MSSMDRRTFLTILKCSALAGVGVLAGVGFANREQLDAELLHGGKYRVSLSRAALGTRVDITAMGGGRLETEDAVEAVFEEIGRYERMFTRYDRKSPVCELNEVGSLGYVEPELAGLLQICSGYHRETGGAFDITVKPCIDLFKACSDAGRRPTDAEIAEALEHVGADRLQMDGSRLLIPEGMGITLDGVAPGFIADRVSEMLLARGITDFLVNAGGEIRTSGEPERGRSWRIAIQDPHHGGQYPGFIALNHSAVSTSGSYEIYYGTDRAFHHIVDAKTGRSPNTSVSVTVTAPTAVEADILSTALFVMTPDEAIRYTISHPSVACLIIDGEGKVIRSPNFHLA